MTKIKVMCANPIIENIIRDFPAPAKNIIEICAKNVAVQSLSTR